MSNGGDDLENFPIGAYIDATINESIDIALSGNSADLQEIKQALSSISSNQRLLLLHYCYVRRIKDAYESLTMSMVPYFGPRATATIQRMNNLIDLIEG
jgi:hypothetical protein